jgi:glucose-6-phosphate-specific signal transduction histidine kinase
MAAIAAAYAACYELTRHFSFSHWILPAGLRLACALLVPRRFWPALLLGEALPVIESAALCVPSFGMLWGAVASLPLIAPCLVMVSVMQRRTTLYRPGGEINMPMILVATVGAALITAVLTDAALVVALLGSPGSWPEIDPAAYFLAYFLGAYLGALTLTPILLALRERFDRAEGTTFSAVRASPLLREILCGAAPVLLALALLAQSTEGGLSQGFRLAMAAPVVIVTARHGWHGAAVTGMLASIAMATTASTLMDAPMIRAQVVLSLTISGALLAGARMARKVPPHTMCSGVEADADAR